MIVDNVHIRIICARNKPQLDKYSVRISTKFWVCQRVAIDEGRGLRYIRHLSIGYSGGAPEISGLVRRVGV